MKVLLVFLCTVFGVLAHHLPRDEKQKLLEIHEACQNDPTTRVEVDLLKRMRENKENRQVLAHVFCMAKKIGFEREDGELVRQTLRDKIALVTHDQTKVDGLVRKCDVRKENPAKTAVNLWLCFLENDIHYIFLVD